MDDQLLADAAAQAQDFGDLGGAARTQDQFGPAAALAGEVVAVARIDGIAGDDSGGVEPLIKLGKKPIDLLCHGAWTISVPVATETLMRDNFRVN